MATPQETPAKLPKKTPDVVFVPTPHEVVAVMLRLAEVDENDTVYDLGCGDGRIVVTAAQRFGAHGVGIDIDPERIAESRKNAQDAGVTGKVRFMEADLFGTDLRPATAVTLYLLPELNVRLIPKLMKELKPGTPIVSHDFDMGDWKPEKTEEVQGPSRSHTVYQWRIPAKAAGLWNLRLQNGQTMTMRLAQNIQKVSGSVMIGGKRHAIAEGQVTSNTLSFVVPREGGTAPLRFEGRFTGKRLAGNLDGLTPATLSWSATQGGSPAPLAAN